ncbi:MAG: hypothetical protein PVJ38_02540 [Candidatus Bathyarchaeota archaeon]
MRTGSRTQVILDALEKGPTRWTPLTRRALKDSTPWRVQSTLEWLLREGYIERPSRGIYTIAERGVLLLRALSTGDPDPPLFTHQPPA